MPVPDARDAGSTRVRAVPRVVAVAAWGLIAGAYAACGLFTVFVTAPLLPDDLAIYRAALQRAWTGGDPYHPFGVGASFVYPPTALALLSPLALLGDHNVRGVWGVLTVALYGLSAWIISIAPARRSDNAASSDRQSTRDERHTGEWAVAVIAVLLYAPFLETTIVGQTNAVVLLGLTLFLARGRAVPRWMGDAGLAIAMCVKMTPVVLLASPIVRREWRSVVRVVLVSIVLASASAALFGFAPWSGFTHILPRLAAGDASGSNQAASAAVVAAASALGAPASAANALARLIVAVLVGWWLWTLTRAPRGDAFSLDAMGVAIVTSASTIVWYHHLTLLMPVLVALLAVDAHGSRAIGNDATTSDAAGRRFRASPRAAALCGLALIQSDRVWEVMLSAPPIAATLGALIVAYAAWGSGIGDQGSGRAHADG